MALFDALIRDLDQRFGLGGQGETLVRWVVGAIADPARGGLRGFIQRFQEAGFGDLAASWVTKVRAGLPLGTGELEAAMGRDFGAGLEARLGLAADTVREAIVYAVPRIVELLTPVGFVQDPLGAEVQSFLDAAPAALAVAKAPVSAPRPPATPARAAPSAAPAVVPTTAATAVEPTRRLPAAPRPPAAPAQPGGVPLWGWLAALAWAGVLAWCALYLPVPAKASAAARPGAASTPRAMGPAPWLLQSLAAGGDRR